MTRQLTIAGLQWRHHGPSFFELAGYPGIEVAYLGEGAPGEANQWFTFAAIDNGEIHVASFPSRDAACAAVAEAIRA